MRAASSGSLPRMRKHGAGAFTLFALGTNVSVCSRSPTMMSARVISGMLAFRITPDKASLFSPLASASCRLPTHYFSHGLMPSRNRCLSPRKAPLPPGGTAQDPNACCFGESLLLVVKGQQGVGSDFNGDGDMEEIQPADRNGESVLGAEFARGADGVAPVELGAASSRGGLPVRGGVSTRAPCLR